MSLPAGAIGFSHPRSGLAGLAGRLIAWRQAVQAREATLPGVSNPGAISHVRLALGDGRVIEMTWPRWRIRSEREAAATPGGIIWYLPPASVSSLERERLTAAAEALALAGGRYGLLALLRFLIVGSLGRNCGFVCTSGAATLVWVAWAQDVSGIGQPWNVDLRTWLTFVHAAGWERDS